MFTTFIRNWWKESTDKVNRWPDNLEPGPTARKQEMGTYQKEEDARQACQHYNSTHKPGRLSRKMEYTSQY